MASKAELIAAWRFTCDSCGRSAVVFSKDSPEEPPRGWGTTSYGMYCKRCISRYPEDGEEISEADYVVAVDESDLPD